VETAERKNVTEQVVNFLKTNITKGVWAPGEKITSENELTRELGVSRASVRYAIQHLVAVGVLESFQGKGTFVKSIPVSEIGQKLEGMYDNSGMKQLVEFRIILETEACRLAAGRITKEGRDGLKICLANMLTDINDNEAFIRDDMEFHRQILQASGNDLIVKSMSCIQPELERQHHEYNTLETRKTAMEYHREILVALLAGSGDEAAMHMKEHLENLGKVISSQTSADRDPKLSYKQNGKTTKTVQHGQT